MQCEICGSAADRKAEIEGAVLNVCGNCSRYGTEIKNMAQKKAVSSIRLPDEMQFALTENFAETARQAREKKRLSQEQLASAIKEKASLVRRMEEGWNPPLHIARKLEKFLGIKIVENVQQEAGKAEPVKSGITIGDVVIIKRKAGTN